MVKAIVDIDDEANKVINILKAQYGLRDKSQAINKLAKEYREIVLESEFRPEYIRRLLEVQKEPIIRVGRPPDLRKRYGLK
ncbi:MAG: DUF2683 family protein [Thaumarchaeota archaeon]|nr:DUF2683 family protein [Nitrososphaerota archaeon]